MGTNTWHEHCVLRDDVRQGTLELAEFAADLYAVRMKDAPNVYQIPTLFFERTYPTHKLKTLVRNVLRRLSGQGGNPILTLQVAYGGGKTHALIALLHLAEHGTDFQTHPTVQEFIQFSGLTTIPRTRVAILPFDQFDVNNGFQAIAPDGTQKTLKTPWGALAYQLAGDKGLEILAKHEADYINPAETPLVNLLKLQQNEGLSTLILLDETLMYTCTAVKADPNRYGILRDFFQVLTQAVKKVNNTAIVASLITADIIADDLTDIRVLNMLETIFHRLDETAEPISQGDVSELLRRRLFEYVPPESTRRSIVDSLIAARQRLHLRGQHTDQEAYDKLLKSYPFHPNLIDVFEQKWTQREISLTDENFQEKGLEIVPIEHAELHELSAELLVPGQLPGLWQGDDVPITVDTIREFFDGHEVPKLTSRNVLLEAIQSAVQNGLLMARHKDKAYLKEAISDTEITDDLELLAPLEPISSSEISHKNLPDAWENETSSVGKIMHALSVLKGSPIPWPLVVDAVDDARDKKLFQFIEGSPPWPCAANEAHKVGLKISQTAVKIAPTDLIGTDAKTAWDSENPTLGLIKETLESNRGVIIPDHVFLETATRAINSGLIIADVPITDAFYHVRVRQGAWIRHAESHLTEIEIQDLPEAVTDLANIAPELDFKFRISISAEGEPPSNELLEQINTVLQKVTDKLKFD